VEELFQIRILLEVTALQMAIDDVTDEELNLVSKSLTGLDERHIDENPTKEQYYASDRELHHLIMKYSRNSRMIAFHKNIESQLERLRRISSMTPMRLAVSREEHMDLLEAIRSHDIKRATEALTTHLNNVRASTLYVCKNVRLGFINPS
jgi:DNA-binding GntR family transcriptional regulator